MEQLADGDGGAQSFKIQGGAAQLADRRLVEQIRARGGQVRSGVAVTCIDWGGQQEGCRLQGQCQQGPDGNNMTNGSSQNPVVSTHASCDLPQGLQPTTCQLKHHQNTKASVCCGELKELNSHTATAAAAATAGSMLQRPVDPFPVVVHTSGGDQIRCRHVILAMPPPVYHGMITFQPPLPWGKQELGRRMFMGSAVKCGVRGLGTRGGTSRLRAWLCRWFMGWH